MPPRLYCPLPLHHGGTLDLPPAAARHAQVLRLQPGAPLVLFGGADAGGEFEAVVESMGRQQVRVRVGAHRAVEREAARAVHLAVGMPANERMDWLVEKAAELGVASIQPLLAERSVLRLAGERAQKRRLHWQQIAVAACEQCGRNRVPPVGPPLPLAEWLAASQTAPGGPGRRWLLSLEAGAAALPAGLQGQAQPLVLLSGPEGGFTAAEETAARGAGFAALGLGPRVLRADTAPLAALAALALLP